MCAAFGCRHGVAVGLHEAVGLTESGGSPGNRPLHLSRLTRPFPAAGEGLRRHRLDVLDPLSEEVREAVGKPEGGFRRRLIVDPRRVA